MKSLYVETTIPSLATARASRDIIVAGMQASSILFWENEKNKYDLYISQYVLEECAKGDKAAAQKRLDFIKDITVLPRSDKIETLANIYQKFLNIPESAKTDCFHLATCVISEIDYLLSWNCTHLGIHTFVKIKDYNEKNGLWTPLLITPESLIIIEEEP